MENIFHSEGFLYGYGVFETMKVINKDILNCDCHYDRLKEACEALDIKFDIDAHEFHELLSIEASKIEEPISGIRFTVIKNGDNSLKYINKRAYSYSPEIYEKGFKLKFSEYKRNPFSKLVYYKTLNYMENLSELRNAKSKGFDEVIFFNTSDMLCECSTSNIFYIKDHVIYTPAIENGLLKGVMREKVLKWCRHHHYKVVEKNIEKSELLEADEVFLTNSLMGIMPVASIENIYFQRVIVEKLVKNLN